jgi:hypothetical protein
MRVHGHGHGRIANYKAGIIPYGRDGQPTGTYYKHAVTFPHGLKDW